MGPLVLGGKLVCAIPFTLAAQYSPLHCSGLIARYRTCNTSADVKAVQDKIINELEEDYAAQRNKGNVSSMSGSTRRINNSSHFNRI